MSVGVAGRACPPGKFVETPTPGGVRVRSGSSPALVRAVLAAHLTGAAGVVLLAWLLGGAGSYGAALAVLLGTTPLVALSWRRSMRVRCCGTLWVAVDGAARWQADDGVVVQLEPRRWAVLGGLACVDGLAAGRDLRLVLGRSDAGDAAWRQLMAWFRWMDRGGRAGPALGNPPGRPNMVKVR